METKNLIIICATIILAVIIVLSAVMYTNMGNETTIKSNIGGTIQNGDEISLNLVDKNSNPLPNKTVTISFENKNGNVTSYDLTTDDNGEVDYKVNLTEGNYTFTAKFDGELFLQSSDLNKSIEIENEVKSADSSSTQSKSKTYGDWQKDYETGEYDEFGDPIYRSVMSTSGGQYDPGIYESYWSANGPISERRIG